MSLAPVKLRSIADERLIESVAKKLAAEIGSGPHDWATHIDEARKQVVAFNAIRDHFKMTARQF